MSGRRIAAFDFDGTISRRDTLVPFLARACGTAALASGALLASPHAGSAQIYSRGSSYDYASPDRTPYYGLNPDDQDDDIPVVPRRRATRDGERALPTSQRR